MPNRPLMTRAAFVSLQAKEHRRDARARLHRLVQRGYNSLILPLMQHGGVTVRLRKAGELEGPLADVLPHIFTQERCSVWLYIDPLSASTTGEARLGSLAKEHRDWLIRNTQGHLTPIGDEYTYPLFSWMNTSYRRYLADLLVVMAETQPFSGIVLDLRCFPGMSDNQDFWYCCSYESQTRAEQALGLDFEQLLSEGSRKQIADWKKWVLDELGEFLSYLKARTHVARSDLSWKLLIPRMPTKSSSESMPWFDWFDEGLMDELMVANDGRTPTVSALIDQIDQIAGRRMLTMPVYENEATLHEADTQLAKAPTPGFAVIEPLDDPSADPLPDCQSNWRHRGALEDEPLLASTALAAYLETEFGEDEKLGRFFHRVRQYLGDFEPEPDELEKMFERTFAFEDRLAKGDLEIPDDKRHLLREMKLINRLMLTIPAPPVSY